MLHVADNTTASFLLGCNRAASPSSLNSSTQPLALSSCRRNHCHAW